MLELALPVPKSYDLERAVCSHGFFMLSPNHWDPLSRTFSRPLRVSDSESVLVSISQPHSHSLLLRVHSTLHQKSLPVTIIAQVKRMLRLSEQDERNAKDFHEMMMKMRNKEWVGSGRVFRSPTLFEDMVKCILLCNCQWSRTLSMATALCNLQVELQCKPSIESVVSPKTDTINFIPHTPAAKEYKRKKRTSKLSTNLATMFEETEAELGAGANLSMESAELRIESFNPSFNNDRVEVDACEKCNTSLVSHELYTADPCRPSGLQTHQEIKPSVHKRICNFPSPAELANLDEKFLAKRCNLGYRASRIIKLAQGIVEGRIPMEELEKVCDGGSLSRYNELVDKLKQIEGFGPFTRANVLMCMGFYHVIPTDSETMRHLKQVHAKDSTIGTIQRDVEEIYGGYAPFQFLAYWEEIWHFYNQKFGKLSEMSCTDYKLITASNLRSKEACLKRKRTKIS